MAKSPSSPSLGQKINNVGKQLKAAPAVLGFPKPTPSPKGLPRTTSPFSKGPKAGTNKASSAPMGNIPK